MAHTRIAGTALALLVAAASVSAHGHAISIIINGLSYKGWDLGIGTDKLTVGWQGVPDDGPVKTTQYQSGDIVCGNSATPAPGHAVAAAGSTVYVQWDLDQDQLGQAWPVEHKGPIIDMLAPCPDAGCSGVDKESLEFFTIAQAGLIDGQAADGGKWHTDVLIENKNGWVIQIPASVAPGFYVLRHEIIALHNAPNTEGGAQNYPQCFNLEITGAGTEKPQGTKATSLYSVHDRGIAFSIWEPMDSYPIPGPKPIADAKLASQEYRPLPTGEGKVLQGSEKSQPASSPGSDTKPTTKPSETAPPQSQPPAITDAPEESPAKSGDHEEQEQQQQEEDVPNGTTTMRRTVTVTSNVGSSPTSTTTGGGRGRGHHGGHKSPSSAHDDAPAVDDEDMDMDGDEDEDHVDGDDDYSRKRRHARDVVMRRA